MPSSAPVSVFETASSPLLVEVSKEELIELLQALLREDETPARATLGVHSS